MLGRCWGAALVAASLVVTPAIAGEKAMIVMDASGSMWGQIEGRTKIEIARETLAGMLAGVPGDLELGLIAYGHREKGACGDIEEMVAAGTGTREAISDAVAGLNPKGKTPLSAAVRQAAEALRFTEEKATVILITDGIETCEADPCAAAAELEALGIDFTAHVISFGMTAAEGRQVACIAEATGGTFLEARNAGELAAALTQTVAAVPAEAPVAPEPEAAAIAENVAITAVLAEGADATDLGGSYEIFAMEGDTPAADALDYGYATRVVATLEPGRYLLRYRKDLVTAETVVEVVAGDRVERELVLDAGVLKVAVRAAEGEEPTGEGAFEVTAGEASGGGYGTETLVVPAGEVALSARIGSGSVARTVTVAAGETVEADLVVGIGVLRVSATYSEGGPAVTEGNLFTEVFAAKKSLDGSRASFAGDYGAETSFSLAPGDYLVRVTLGKAVGESVATVAMGEASEIVVDLDAGVLAVTAPGAYWIEVFDAETDIQGNRASVAGEYGEALQVTLPPGDYVVVRAGEGGADTREAPVSVRAAERAEVSVE